MYQCVALQYALINAMWYLSVYYRYILAQDLPLLRPILWHITQVAQVLIALESLLVQYHMDQYVPIYAVWQHHVYCMLVLVQDLSLLVQLHRTYTRLSGLDRLNAVTNLQRTWLQYSMQCHNVCCVYCYLMLLYVLIQFNVVLEHALAKYIGSRVAHAELGPMGYKSG